MPIRLGPWELLMIMFIVFPYVWTALCLMVIANKTGTPNSWLAWIPVLNIYLLCKVAGHSGLWMAGYYLRAAIGYYCYHLVLDVDRPQAIQVRMAWNFNDNTGREFDSIGYTCFR